jgi:stage V sporulation protein B
MKLVEKNNVVKGTLKLTIANVFDRIIMAIFYIIVIQTNALTQKDIGTLSILSFLALTFSLLTMLALPIALTKFMSEKIGKNKPEEARGVHKIITKSILILSFAGFLIVIPLSQLISQYFWNNPDFIILLIINFIYAFLSNITTLCRSTLQALCLFGEMAIINITFIISSRIIAIALTTLQMGPTGVIIGYIIGSIITIIPAIYYLRNRLLITTKKMPLKPILYFSFPLFLSAITLLVLQQADIIIITSFTGDLAQTGIYSIVVNSVATLSLLYIPVMTTLFPVISPHDSSGKLKNITKILKITSRYLIYIIFPACIGLAIIAHTALDFFYGLTYVKGATPLAILSISAIMTALYLLFETTLKATGKTEQILKINIIAAISSILMLLALVPLLDITGAAIARLITQVITITIAIYILNKKIKIQFDTESIWKSALSTTAMIPLLLTIEFALSSQLSTAQTLALEIAIGAGIYAVSLYLLKALKKQDFDLLKQAFPKFLTKFLSVIERIVVR